MERVLCFPIALPFLERSWGEKCGKPWGGHSPLWPDHMLGCEKASKTDPMGARYFPMGARAF